MRYSDFGEAYNIPRLAARIGVGLLVVVLNHQIIVSRTDAEDAVFTTVVGGGEGNRIQEFAAMQILFGEQAHLRVLDRVVVLIHNAPGNSSERNQAMTIP